MNSTTFVSWTVAWTLLDAVVLLAAAWLARRLPSASVRHFSWILAFSCVALLPIFAAAKWIVQKDNLATRTQKCPDPQADANDARDCPTASPGKLFGSLSSILLGGWFAGVAWNFGGIVLGLRTVRRWRKQSVEYDLPAEVPANALRNISVRIARGAAPVVPIASGFWKPMILLPQSAQSWDLPRISAVLWHELGHLRRHDNLSQLCVLFVCALHWFNPLFWFASRRMEADAEIAADDFAILRGVKPSSYAASLLSVASELGSSQWKFPLAHTAMVKNLALEDRLRSIIDPKSQRGAPPIRACAIVALAFAGLGIVLVLLASRLPLDRLRTEAAPTCPIPIESDRL